jgi:4-amino-4-deoxy-L-arabinose transferase-like glycosyltransferase
MSTSIGGIQRPVAAASIPAGKLSFPGKLEKTGRFEFEVVLLTLLVFGTYLIRLGDLPLRGEETRRAQVAREMLQTGDWIVPRQQGAPFLSRPPLGNWLIAAATVVRGQCDPLAVRLPSVLATLLTTLLVYGYSRTLLSRLGALAAAVAYATMAQVMELGRLAETEAPFALLLSASLLVWHWGYSRGWPAACTWVAGYALAALATLAKGPQAPTYFAVSVGLFLLLTRHWRYLFTCGHLIGMAAFALVFGAWQVPFYRQLGWNGMVAIWTSDATLRLMFLDRTMVLYHLATYPLEVLSCTLPWSVLLVFYLSRNFRQTLGETRSGVLFLATCLAVTFPTCWLVPGAQSRYLMPVYPCLAPLIGLVIQRCVESESSSLLRRTWSGLLIVLAVVLLVIGGAILGASFLHVPNVHGLTVRPLFASVYAALATGLGLLALALRRWSEARPVQRGLLALGALLGLSHTGMVVDALARKSENAAPAVARLKEQLHGAAHLVSFGPVHHLFAYHYGTPIALRPWPKQPSDVGTDVTYFCFDRMAKAPIDLPFPWEEVAVISCDRYRSIWPQWSVVVGRRLPRGQTWSGEATLAGGSGRHESGVITWR